ncbi:hypothetical protein M8R20_05350, partial [Pseudomonas sp. R2.Fl]|nr:hypothetical protein [Pseudomonas sp. R2.Fl]
GSSRAPKGAETTTAPTREQWAKSARQGDLPTRKHISHGKSSSQIKAFHVDASFAQATMVNKWLTRHSNEACHED